MEWTPPLLVWCAVHGFADGMFGISAQESVHLGDDRLGPLGRLFDTPFSTASGP